MSCGGGNVGVGVPGPQGPPGPTGPTGPGGGGGGGNNVSIIGNVSGAPALISSGTLFLAGGNNVTLSQNGNSVTISANTAVAANLSISAGSTSGPFGGLTFANGSNVSFGLNNGTITASVLPQSTQTQPAGNIAGIGTTFGGTNVSGSMTLNSNGLNLALSASGGIDASIAGNVAGAPVIISTGTLVLAGGNNVTLSQNGNSITISGANAGGAQTGISGLQVSNTTYTSGTVSLVNANGLTFGSSGANGISASYNSTQFAGTGTTFSGTNISGSMTLNSGGLNLALSGGGGGGPDVTLGGNTSGALALISTGTLFLAGGNNVTLSQNGNSVTISANTAAAANLSVSAGTTTGAFGGLTFSNSNNVSFGLNNGSITASASYSQSTQPVGVSGSNGSFAFSTLTMGNLNGISHYTSNGSLVASYNSTQFGGTGTTFSGTNVSGSITLNSAGLNLALSGAAAGGASTGGIYAVGNTTAQSSSSTYANSSLNLSLAGILSGGWSSNTFVISAPGTTGLTQLSAGMSTGGNTVGTTGLASAQLVLAGGANITLSGSTNGGSMTISISAPSPTGGAVNFSAGTTSSNLASVVFSNSNGVSFGLNGGTITASAAGGGGGVGFGVSTAGNTAGATGTVTTGNVVLVGSGPISLSQATGAAGSAATITINGPATSSISGSGLISVAVAGSTISIGANALTAYAVSNTTQSTSGTVNGTALSFAGAGGVSVGVTNGSVLISGGAGGGAAASVGVSTGGNTSGNTGIYSGQVVFAGGNNITLSVSSGAAGAQTITISGANAGGAQTGISGIVVSNTTYTSGTVSFSNANGISFGSSAGQAITASYTVPSTAGLISRLNVSAGAGTSNALSGLTFANSNSITFGLSTGAGVGTLTASFSTAAQTNQTIGLYAVGNTTQNSSTTLDARTLSFDALGAMTAGFSNGSIQLSVPSISSISGTGQVSISVNGSTISIGVPSIATNTDFFAPYEAIQLAPAQLGQGSLLFDPQQFPNVQFDRVLFPIYNTNNAASSGSHSLSFYFGLYSRNASTLSLIGSTSLSTAVTQSGNVGSYSLYSGMKAFSAGSTTTLSSGNYWMGFVSRTSSAGADGSYSNVALNGGFFTDVLTSGTLAYGGYFGSAVNATNQLPLGQGFYSATTTGMPASVAFTQIDGTASNVGNMQAIVFASSTV